MAELADACQVNVVLLWNREHELSEKILGERVLYIDFGYPLVFDGHGSRGKIDIQGRKGVGVICRLELGRSKLDGPGFLGPLLAGGPSSAKCSPGRV